ncbi:hypothetical protein DFQ28_003149 [Apophysomyces sp. BC1034]|nr:hypothetical protein DFQ30_000270 [Apophysomyces sp. BC1015]KAG0179222.1 hypothetical protein DFQ29_002346 [Apophysomyces sp. BC1021]KAG0189640.1 hypothetical protein DFQ28_003149 [Apophysomyces sp. BC1034]
MPSATPCLLGGKPLTGVLPPERQPPACSFLPSHDKLLADIESCIDDPSLAPLGHHVVSRRRRQKPEDRGQVCIRAKHTRKEIRSGGMLMLRRRDLGVDQLAKDLEALLPPLSPFLQLQPQYKDLVELDISRNRLVALPQNIITLTHLKILNVSSNLLTSVPPQIYHLTQLEVLVLSQNRIQAIPEEMPIRLPNLVTLRVAANNIEHITKNIGRWVRMRHLQLGSVYGGNQLARIPDEIVDMAALEELDVSHNQLRNLPTNMHIPTLKHLNISSNRLHAMPKSITQCSKLKTLNVSKNHLTTLPADLVQLRQLELFDISENLLCILPQGILERMRTTLLITGNPLTRPGNCDLGASDAYARILNQMTRCAIQRPIPDWNRDRCGPQGMGCETPGVEASPSTSTAPLSPPSPLHRQDEDDDAMFDRQLSYHAQQLNIRGSRPSTPSIVGTIAQETTRYTITDDTSMSLSPATNLVHSLRELATRTILRNNLSPPLQYLPVHLADDLSRNCQFCATCQQQFVNEWVSSVQVKSYKGHPAVVSRVRFCSTKCWLGVLKNPKDASANSVVYVHHPASQTDTNAWIETPIDIAVTASAVTGAESVIVM